MSKQPRPDLLEELFELQSGEGESEENFLLPSSDSLEKINVLTESSANSRPSASSTSVIGNNYHVFLSFRGPDTRKSFVDHLYHRLNDVGLRFHTNPVFRDDECLPFGEKIGENLISAIKHSKVSIPVISKNYAASEWCLRELIQIMECEERGEQKVLPVLYKVKPYEVRELKGAFGEAFESRKYRFDEKVKQQGPVALRKALDLRIFESEKFANGHEAELITELVQVIMDEQRHNFLPPLPGNLVGNDDRVAEVMKLADIAPSETRIIGICGIGGIGKTTLAKNIYNKLAKKFECRSFLIDIRETIKGQSMVHIQNILISDITGNRGSCVPDSMRGIVNIQSSCNGKKVLIVLDDVGEPDHLDKLIGHCNFGLGSRIIITCRDKALLKSEYKCYELKEMNDRDSMLLFCLHAFGGKQPPTELATLSGNIVAAAGGFPLTLEIIGSCLKQKGKDEVIWTETLEKLRQVPPRNVQEKLKMSYDSLDDKEKRMFLDIACFFIGINKRFVTYLWKDLGLCPAIGLARMIDLSLIKYGDNDELRMHDQLRDLGRDIACPADKESWDWSRLWGEEAMKVLRRKEVNRNIEALRLDENGSNMFMNQRSFEVMPNLKFLHLSKVGFVGNSKDSLSELRWLEWEKCPNSFKVTNVHLENLLILDLSNGYISHEWRGWSSIKMERLKVLNLSQCIELKRTPNLSVFKSLEMLILEESPNLEEIDPSIGDAKYLTSLILSGCHKLKKLPSQIGKLKRLISLNLSFCYALEELPKEMGQLEELKELNAHDCNSLVGLPDSISHMVNLSTLDLRWCEKFKELPESIGSLVKLQCLLLGNMALPSEHGEGYEWESYVIYQFDHIPYSIGKLESLTELHFTCAQISKLPESIGDLKNLKILKIAGCEELSSLPSTISKLGKLEELDAIACDSLKGGVSINGLSSLKILRLGKLGHINMKDIGHLRLLDLSDLSSRQHLDLTNCDLPASLTVLEVTCRNPKLPQLSHLGDLKELSFQLCESLESIPVLPLGLLDLWVVFCGKLKKLPSLSNLESLSELHIIGCSELMEIEGLKGLKSLRGLFICGCKKLSNLNGLEHLESLRDLEIEDLDASLMNDHQFQVQCLGGLKNLESLCIIHCQSLTRLDISQLINLEALWVFDCEDLDKIEGLERLKKLRHSDIPKCKFICKSPPECKSICKTLDLSLGL
ncbi:hypothetical protein ACJRO7_013590 [Eucalyptus globulus]|uniref:TIR domain-containing protein n=1 Tax=Eucalyptus globulus TaxID=34317 RepID=A0ABD3KY44_EUCGL